METNDIRLDIKPKAKNKYSKVVSWENLSVITKISLTQQVKAKVNCKDESKYEKTLLNKINGIVRPGEMVALMGARYFLY